MFLFLGLTEKCHFHYYLLIMVEYSTTLQQVGVSLKHYLNSHIHPPTFSEERGNNDMTNLFAHFEAFSTRLRPA